jgi:molecular chaperone DnaJ
MGGGGGGPRGGFGGAGSGRFRSAPFRTCSKTCSAISWAGAAAAAGRSRAQRGSDLRYNLRVSLEEAFAGVQKTINVPTSVSCETCRGTGAEGGAEPVTCPTCSGMGKVRAQQGFFTVERTCPTCNGRGQIVKNPCKPASGQGRVEKERRFRSTSRRGGDRHPHPPGGRGRGGPARRPSGDLYIFIEVKEHAIFQRDGVNLLLPRAGLDGHRRPGRRGRGADDRRRQEAASRFPRAARPASRCACAARACRRCAAAQAGDMLIELAVETPVNLTGAAERTAARVRQAVRRQQPRRLERSFPRSRASGTA